MKVLNYGSLNIDCTYRVPHIALAGETIASTSVKRNVGGKGSNQSAAIALAGGNVWHAGKIGKDGLFIVELLKSRGVNTDLIAIDEDVPTGQAMIQVDSSGQNSIVLFAGANKRIEKGEIDRTLSSFEGGDYIVLQNEINNLEYIFEKAIEKGMKIAFNPSPFDESLLSLPLDKASILFVNEIEGGLMAQAPAGESASAAPEAAAESILQSLSAKYPDTEIVLTMGKEGAWHFFKGAVERGTIVDLPVADTTGAGDTFTGYFLVSRFKGYSVREALALACKASSIAVSRPGAMEAIPAASEVFE